MCVCRDEQSAQRVAADTPETIESIEAEIVDKVQLVDGVETDVFPGM